MCQEPKKLAERGLRNFCGDFNARKTNFASTANLKGSKRSMYITVVVHGCGPRSHISHILDLLLACIHNLVRS